MMNEFPRVEDDELITPTMDEYKLGCCDCGLVHRLKFRAIRVLEEKDNGDFEYEELEPKEYRVVFSGQRDSKSTSALRLDGTVNLLRAATMLLEIAESRACKLDAMGKARLAIAKDELAKYTNELETE